MSIPHVSRLIANGVDTETFSPRVRSTAHRLTQWKRWLVDDPRGWCPGGAEGSISYEADDLAAFTDEAGQAVPVVVFAGRFLRFKRVQLLIEAHQSMRSTTGHRSVLVVAGGFPGEWEDEHPYDTVRRVGAEGVFFIGWRDHDELAEILRCSDVFAAPSVDEPFGLVYLEAMAAGLPPIATNTGGPASFINVDPAQPTGWLVPPDDVAATARALAEAIADPLVRVARGHRAARFVRERYSSASPAAELTDLYQQVVDERAPPSPTPARSETHAAAGLKRRASAIRPTARDGANHVWWPAAPSPSGARTGADRRLGRLDVVAAEVGWRVGRHADGQRPDWPGGTGTNSVQVRSVAMCSGSNASTRARIAGSLTRPDITDSPAARHVRTGSSAQ